MPRPIKYATIGSHNLEAATASASGALVSDGTTGSATPIGRCRLVSLECTITGGGGLAALATVTSVYLASDANGYFPITEAGINTKLGTLLTSASSGFSIRLEQDAYIEGPIYAVAKLASGDSGTGTWKLTFVQGG